MEYSIKRRKVVYNKFVTGLDKEGRGGLKLVRDRLLGKGYQGEVFSFCQKKLCTAVKKMYLENRQARFLKTPFSVSALKYENFIELAAMKLTNELVLQGVSPHFILHYKSTFKERETGACIDEYPHSSKYYNEFIDGSETFTNWVRDTHSLNEWYNAYFQITVAIYCLQKHFNMIHLDLHSDNILVKRVKPGGQWKYIIDNTTYYVPNYGYIFYINDFGHAWIPQNFQSWIVRTKMKKRKRRVHKNFDIMKLFGSTLEFSTSPREFKARIRKLIKDLESNNFVDIINSIWNNYTTRTRTRTIETYHVDAPIDPNPLPKPLRHLALNVKRVE